MVARRPSAWGCGPGRTVQSDSPAAAHSLRSSDPPHDPRHSSPDEGLITANNFVRLRVNRFANSNPMSASISAGSFEFGSGSFFIGDGADSTQGGDRRRERSERFSDCHASLPQGDAKVLPEKGGGSGTTRS